MHGKKLFNLSKPFAQPHVQQNTLSLICKRRMQYGRYLLIRAFVTTIAGAYFCMEAVTR